MIFQDGPLRRTVFFIIGRLRVQNHRFVATLLPILSAISG
jgi:hypothetical protein